MESLKKQFKENALSIFNLILVLAALVFTAWRSEISEKNQNLRTAGFEVLKNLGELQMVVNYAYFQPGNMQGNPYLGWGHVSLISDLSQLLPDPVPKVIQKLVTVWGEESNQVKMSEEAANRVSMQIDVSREEVLKSIRTLN